jgi:tripartite-type tricarboxylate transporter receptor subunit TctC
VESVIRATDSFGWFRDDKNDLTIPHGYDISLSNPYRSLKGKERRRKMKRLSFTVVIVGVLVAFFQGNEIRAAEPYPARPITFIVPVEAGSDADILARPLAQKASTFLSKPVVVVNKPGAGSSIGYREIYGAKPDGYTIGMATITIVSNKLQGIFPLDYHDFGLLGTFYRIYANVFGSTKTKRPFKTIEEVIAFAKSHPGQVSLASAGIGQSLWVAAMAFISGTGINVNVIPQPGGGGFAITQIAGGHADLAITHLPSAKPQIEAGNVRFLAVEGYERAPGYENVPTLKEVGYDISWESSGIIMGPPKMPKDVTDKLTKAFEVAANDPEYHKYLLERFTMPFYLPPDKIVNYLDGRRKVVREIMDKAGILKEK